MTIKIVSMVIIMIIDNNEITVPTPKEGNMITVIKHEDKQQTFTVLKAYNFIQLLFRGHQKTKQKTYTKNGTWTELRPSI